MAEGRASIPLSQPQPGWVEQDIEDWWSAACSALRQLAGELDMSRVAALAISNQRETVAFVDANGNGYQDEGERGIPSVRLATVKGELITTDEFGRYHIACAAVPDARIGSNYVLKVDTATLPEGWVMTTENPRSIRLTRGKMGELNFGAALALQASMTFEAEAFAADGSIRPDNMARLQAFADDREGATMIRAVYLIDGSETRDLINDRINAIKTAVETTFAAKSSDVTPVIQVHAVEKSQAGDQ